MTTLAVADQANSPQRTELAQQYIKEEPRSLKGVVERLVHKTEKRLSISTLKRLAKKARLRWKRVRKSLKSLRDPDAFARCQRDLAALQQQETKARLLSIILMNLALRLIPPFPMPGKRRRVSSSYLPCAMSAQCVRFLNRNNDLHAYMFEQSIHTGVVCLF